MARSTADKPIDSITSEDEFSDADFENWEVVSEDFGEQITWTEEKTVIIKFIGTKDVTQEDGSVAPAALYESKNGSKYFSWLPTQLADVINGETVRVGDILRIEYKGERETRKSKSGAQNPVKQFDIRVKPRSS